MYVYSLWLVPRKRSPVRNRSTKHTVLDLSMSASPQTSCRTQLQTYAAMFSIHRPSSNSVAASNSYRQCHHLSEPTDTRTRRVAWRNNRISTLWDMQFTIFHTHTHIHTNTASVRCDVSYKLINFKYNNIN